MTLEVSIHTLHELEASLHPFGAAYLLRVIVSIHTLHELEARFLVIKNKKPMPCKFPFIRFTNWKQAGVVLKGLVSPNRFPFIRFTNWKQEQFVLLLRCEWLGFPFIRFTNWKQDQWCPEMAQLVGCDIVSIHTLHELEARKWEVHTGDRNPRFPFIRFTNWKQAAPQPPPLTPNPRFHSYASRIGSKTSFAKLGCTRIVQRFFVGYWKA